MSNGPPIKDGKVYGDETALQRLQYRPLKEANGEVPVARRDAGGPAGGPAWRGAPGVVSQGQPEVEPSPYSDLYHAFGRAARAAIAADLMSADPLSGPWLRTYNRIARERLRSAGEAVRLNTPYLEE